MNVFDSLLSVIAPHDCIGCQSEGSLLCSDCRDTLVPAAKRCYKCHAAGQSFATCRDCAASAPLGAVLAATRYNGLAKDLVWKLKFGHSRAAADEIAAVLVDRLRLKQRLPAMNDLVIVHAPTATSRVRQRGYDQSALIAQAIARQCRVPYHSLLRRHGHQEQIGASKTQRHEQLADAFRIARPSAVRGSHIILIDDIVTTGATLDAAAIVLKRAGVSRIDAIVFAQA